MIKKPTLLGEYHGDPLVIPQELVYVLSTNEDSKSSEHTSNSPTSQELSQPPSPKYPSQPIVGQFINAPNVFPPSDIVATPEMATIQLPNLTIGY